MFRFILPPMLLLTACGSGAQFADNAAVPALENRSEVPGDWSGLERMVGRTPAESGLFENSPITVDLNAKLGPDQEAYRTAMMRAGPLTREGRLLVARAPDAWLVLQPGDHAMRAALRSRGGWREWQTAGADVPRPSPRS